jgi:hypothetical protein
MFLNISKKSCERWNKKQIDQARELGGHIIDVVPPDILPSDDIKIIKGKADELFDHIIRNYDGGINTIYIDHYSLFNNRFIERCKNCGIYIVKREKPNSLGVMFKEV